MKNTLKRRKTRLHKKRDHIKHGLAPGTLTVDPNSPKPSIQVFAYEVDKDVDDFVEKSLVDLSEVPKLLKQWSTVWINISGLGDIAVIEKIGNIFDLHQLALEDVLNINHRPKVEEFENHLFIIMKLLSLEPELSSEQISIFLGKGFVLTFQEKPGDSFDGVRDRIRKGKGRIRIGPEYLTYALLDSIVDSNFPLLEAYGERLEALETETLEQPDKSTITKIYTVKRELLSVRRAVWPSRDLFNSLIRDQEKYFSGESLIFLRDCYDHIIQIVDLIENYREIASGLIELYLSSISNKMNDVMKVLTLIATIFMPLGFLAGLYGMNFNNEVSFWNMPETQWRYGYPFALLLMGSIASGMVLFFRNKKWL